MVRALERVALLASFSVARGDLLEWPNQQVVLLLIWRVGNVRRVHHRKTVHALRAG